MNEMYEYLEEHAYISKNKKSNYQFELTQERAECIANKHNSLCEEKDNEIERLKKDKEIDVKLNLELLDAVGKLNNILNELEKWLEKEQVNSVDLDEWTIIQVRDKILELKGDSSNGR